LNPTHPVRDYLDPEPRVCRWGPDDSSCEEWSVERAGSLPSREQETHNCGNFLLIHEHCPFLQSWAQGRPRSPERNTKAQAVSQRSSGPVQTFS